MPTRQQLHEIYYQGPDATVEFIENLYCYVANQAQSIGRQQRITIDSLSAKITRLQSQLKRTKDKLSQQQCLTHHLTRRVQQLETALKQTHSSAQIQRDSHNSHFPPSSDRPAAKAANSIRRTRSLRQRTGRKAGGQAGHPGTTLPTVEQPDRLILHEPKQCRGCGASLTDCRVVACQRRQVFDLPPVKVEVIEHRAETRCCAKCGVRTKATFPQEVRGRVQYGEGVRARAIYLQKYQLLPYQRTSEAMRDLFGCSISAGALRRVGQRCSEKLINTELRIKSGLKQAEVIGADETGVRVGGKSHWIHVARTDELTHYGYDARRGKAAMEAINILPEYKGTMVRDGWYSYDQMRQCRHGLCNAHLLREMIYVGELDERQQQWTGEMIGLLLEIKEEVERERARGEGQIRQQRQQEYLYRYDQVIAMANKINGPPEGEASPAGEVCKEARRLIRRLEQRREEVLRFMTDLRVPFDNNGTERDLRMVKLQQKIGGSFRTPEGAEEFCRIRSYISSARKQNHSLLIALERVFRDKPLVLTSSSI